MKIVIDAGHGGPDPGAVGPTKLREADVNLAVAKAVVSLLGGILTRETDAELPLDKRTTFSKGADCFVSIHCNSAENSQAHGTETYVHYRNPRSRELGWAVQKALVDNLGLADRGLKVQQKGFYVVRYAYCPACLTELAFIRNPREEGLLRDPAWQAQAARAIANGIKSFLGGVGK